MTDKAECPDHEEHHTGTTEKCDKCNATYKKPLEENGLPRSPFDTLYGKCKYVSAGVMREDKKIPR